MASEYDPGMEYQSWKSVAPTPNRQGPGILAGLLASALLGKKDAGYSVMPEAVAPTTGLKIGGGLGINPEAASGLGLGMGTGVKPPAATGLSLPNLNQPAAPVDRSFGAPAVSSPTVSQAAPSPSFDLKGFIGKLFPGVPQ